MSDTTSPVVIFEKPTVKDQLIGAGIAIGSTLVMLLVLSGFGWLVEKVSDFKMRRRAKRLAKAQLLIEQETGV